MFFFFFSNWHRVFTARLWAAAKPGKAPKQEETTYKHRHNSPSQLQTVEKPLSRHQTCYFCLLWRTKKKKRNVKNIGHSASINGQRSLGLVGAWKRIDITSAEQLQRERFLSLLCLRANIQHFAVFFFCCFFFSTSLFQLYELNEKSAVCQVWNMTDGAGVMYRFRQCGSRRLHTPSWRAGLRGEFKNSWTDKAPAALGESQASSFILGFYHVYVGGAKHPRDRGAKVMSPGRYWCQTTSSFKMDNKRNSPHFF